MPYSQNQLNQNKFFAALFLLFTVFACKQGQNEWQNEAKDVKEKRTFMLLANGDSLKTGTPIKLPKDTVVLGKGEITRIKKAISDHRDYTIYEAKTPKTLIVPSIEEKLGNTNVKSQALIRDTIIKPDTLKISTGNVKALKANSKNDRMYNIEYMGIEQGLDSEYIFSILEDSRSNLWFGHYSYGVTKYDGETYTTFTDSLGVLSSKNVWSMVEDDDGNIWLSCIESGLVKYDGHSFFNYSEAQGFLGNQVFSMTKDSAGNIWFGTTKGVAKYANGKFTYFDERSGLSGNIVISLLEDSNGNVWMGTTSGITVYTESQFIKYTPEDGIPPNNVISFFEDTEKNIWFGTYDGGVCKLNGTSLSIYTEEEGLINNSIKGIQQDDNGNIWFGSNIGGLCKFDGKTFEHISIKEGLPSDRIRTMLIDSGQNLWGGTEGGGVFKLKLNSFVNRTPTPKANEIQEYGRIFAMFMDSEENFWLANMAGELIKYDGKKFTSIGKEQNFYYHVIYSAAEDHNKNIWMGTWYGLVKFDGEKCIKYDKESGLKHQRPYHILVDKTNAIWFPGYNAGITKVDQGKAITFTLSPNPEENWAYCLLEDKKGNIWVATEYLGLCKYDTQADDFTFYTENEGLVSNATFSISEDKYGNIWIATSSGLSKFDGTNFVNFTEEDGLAGNSVTWITPDANNNIWVGTQKGLSCLIYDKDMVSKVEDKDLVDNNQAFIVNYDRSDGLRSIDFLREAAYDKDGQLWFATSDGGLTLDVDNHKLPSQPPSIELVTIEINSTFIDYSRLKDESAKTSEFLQKVGQSYGKVKAFQNYPESLSLPHDLNHLNFKFAGLDLSAQQDVQYTFKIEGLDDSWSTLSGSNSADYRNIPPGDYQFKVKARGKTLQWSPILNYTFHIAPPWWLNPWMKMLYVALALMLTGFALKRYTLKQKRKQLALEQIIKERTRTIQLQKQEVQDQKAELAKAYDSLEIERNKMELKALLNQINPHFIFNALNSIQQFILRNNTEASLNYFNKLGKLLRASIEHSELKYVPISEEINVIENYVELENLRFDSPVQLTFNTHTIDVFNTKIPPMFLQPLVENAIIHGLSKKEGDKQITIEFSEGNDAITCIVTDNGIGRIKRKTRKNKNSGLVITQKRLNSVWSNSNTDVAIEFEDLKNSKNQPIGTKAIIRLPKSF